METRVLIGSCGGLTGSYLVRQFKKKGCYVVAADSNPENVTRHFADKFIQLPPSNDPAFIEKLITSLRENDIYAYVPTHSKEIREIARQEEVLRKEWAGNFIVSPYETFEKLDNKKVANTNLKKAGIPVPELILSPGQSVTYPIFMKPDEGSGSRKAQAVESLGLHQEYAQLDPGASFYQMIRGTEYTVDCIFDEHGILLAYNQRIRVKSMGGAVIITKTNHHFDIFPFLKKLAASFTFKGCVNFQYILSGGIPYFIDINLRYAAGGLPLTVALGIDVPQILLDLWDHGSTNIKEVCPSKTLTMYRYFEEWYEDSEL